MSNATLVPASLYVITNKATLIMKGLGVETRHDACLMVSDGVVKATKFGLYEVGPSTAQYIEGLLDVDGENIFDRIDVDVQAQLFHADGHYYIPSTLERIFEGDDEYALYDAETEMIWRPESDSLQDGVYNLVGLSRNSIEKIEVGELKSQMGARFTPLVRVESR